MICLPQDFRGAFEKTLLQMAEGIETLSEASYKQYLTISRGIDRKLDSKKA